MNYGVSMVRKLFILFCLGIISCPVYLFAGIYGSIKGQIVDPDDKPIPRASVLVEGTTLGAYANNEGRFTILSVSPGSYHIRITSVGYAKKTLEARVSTDEITDLGKISLDVEAKMTSEVIVKGMKYVDATGIGTKSKFTTEDLTSSSRENLNSIVGLSVGVFNTTNGWVIRGARTTETQIRVDGFDVGNQFTGGFGIGGSTYYPMVSAYATEELQVLTGGFSAEYGDAMGGIVNSVLKKGSTEKYEGYLRWRTDVPSLWGSQATGLQVVRGVDRMIPVKSGDGAKLQGPDENNFQLGAGGPLPFLGKSTFFISGSYLHNNYRGYGYERYDPWGLNLGHLPNQQTWVKNIEGRFSFAVSPDLEFTLGGNLGQSNFEVGSWFWMYANQQGYNTSQDANGNWVVGSSLNGVPEWKAKLPVANQNVYNMYMRIHHVLSQNSFYEINISNTANNDEESRRADFNDPGLFSGFNLMTPQDNLVSNSAGDQLLRIYNSQSKSYQTDRILDQFTLLTKPGVSADGYQLNAYPNVNNVTGYIEGNADYSSTNNPYGLALSGFFAQHGNTGGVEFRDGNYWQLDGNYNLNIDGGDKGFTHMMKAGFETRYYTQKRHSNQNPWDGNPFFDVYDDLYGGNIYADNQAIYNATSSPYHPYRASAYYQDQIKYKGITISPGLRLDYFNSNGKYRTLDNVFIPIASLNSDSFAVAPAKVQVSPRINVTYPITLKSLISINYGIYYKMPELQYLYDGFGTYQLRGSSILGNPNMNVQRNNAYQVTYSNELTDIFSLTLSAYYRDVYNQVGLSYVGAVPTPYWIYTVSDYGNAKGLEITFRKAPTYTDHIGFQVNYNLSKSVGTSQGPGSNYQASKDPYSDKLAFPMTEIPTGSDRRHRINLMLNFGWYDGQGPSIAGIKPIENTNINFSGFWQSGLPYTQLDKGQKIISEINALRQPSIWGLDMRLSKNFRLKDWFKDMGNSSIEIFVDVNNILNNRAVTGVNSITGDPIDDGITFYRQKGQFSATTYYKTANYGITQSFSNDQYDNFGQRLYSVYADYNNDGFVTQDEKFQSYVNYVSTAISGQGNYGAPRTIYFGMMFRF
jgi:hypothetical protein